MTQATTQTMTCHSKLNPPPFGEALNHKIMNEIEWNRTDWRDVHKELPGYGGARCVCRTRSGQVFEDCIFHRTRDKSIGKDFFNCHGRAYDYDYFAEWIYTTGYKKLKSQEL